MLIFYILTIIACFIFILRPKIGIFTIFISSFVLLLSLPSTNADYDIYKQACDNAYFKEDFPFFFTDSILTAEPLFLWYISFMGVVIGKSFPLFLAINYLLCMFVLMLGMKNKFSTFSKYYIWLMMFPIIFPTIFYYSPRSSISYIFILCGFIFFSDRKVFHALLCFFVGCMFHSQFGLISISIAVTYFLFRYFEHKKVILFMSIGLYIFLFFINNFKDVIHNIVSFLPTADFIVTKMHYIEMETSDKFRFTSILSIVVFPVIAVLRSNNAKRKTIITKTTKEESFFTDLLLAVIVYGAIINIVYINSPHIAGRLSRFSDYIGMTLLLPAYLQSLLNKNSIINIVAIIFALLAPFLYPTLYTNAL